MSYRLLTGIAAVAAAVILLVSAVLIIRNNKSTYRHYLAQVERCSLSIPAEEAALITSGDLEGLPEPVRKYLEYVGVTGAGKVRHYSVSIDGNFRMSPEKDWAPVKVEQVSFVENPTRLFFMELKFMGLKIFGLHHYEAGAASMVIKILDLFTVADARGPEMNKGETVTVFNDMCILAPASLIDSRISWREIDKLTVEGTFTNGDITVRAVLYFNEEGQLINFSSDDRYYWNEDGSYGQYRWETPVGQYRSVNGLNLASYGEARWIMDDGPFRYAEFNINNVVINPESAE